jgi:hypothetical protein
VRFRSHLARVLVRPTALALACLALFAATSTASAHKGPRKHLGRCNAHLSKHAEVKQTSKVLVWMGEGTSSESGEPVEALYACLRPAGKSVAIGENEENGGEYVGNVKTTNLSISGALVSDAVITGLAEQEACGKYGGTGCAAQVSEVARVYDLTTGRSIHQPLAGAPTAYAFTSLGAIAWEVPTTENQTVLQAVAFDRSNMKAGSVETLDTGVLGRSLHFTGLTLAWTSAGTPKSQTITPAQTTPTSQAPTAG